MCDGRCWGVGRAAIVLVCAMFVSASACAAACQMFDPKDFRGDALTIEINGTFYRTQTPATFAKWAAEVPDGFVFSVKGPRYAVNRSVLAEAGDSIKRFIDSGPLEMGDKLGPMLWQFAPHKKFDAAD